MESRPSKQDTFSLQLFTFQFEMGFFFWLAELLMLIAISVVDCCHRSIFTQALSEWFAAIQAGWEYHSLFLCSFKWALDHWFSFWLVLGTQSINVVVESWNCRIIFSVGFLQTPALWRHPHWVGRDDLFGTNQLFNKVDKLNEAFWALESWFPNTWVSIMATTDFLGEKNVLFLLN